ncbi:MAG: hypothetical protein NWF02_08770 [Candidatus Bathyarchaeota archaeon]|nr:hypothetical protein [Candidatus Bathyarchaeum sp.]
MTLAEFLKAAEKKDSEHLLQDENFGVLQVLNQEGIPKEQALPMKMDKAWHVYINHLINNPTKTLHHFFFASEVEPENTPIVRSQLKKITDIYKEIESDLEEKGSST